MNHFNFPSKIFRTVYRIALSGRWIASKPRSNVFSVNEANNESIGQVFVINLDRRPDRWNLMKQELHHIAEASGEPLTSLTKRVHAMDGRLLDKQEFHNAIIEATYTLRDQLLIEPQPIIQLEKINLDERIQMTRQEIAVALSHIEVWKEIAAGKSNFSLVLEDDVYFKYNFQKLLRKAWKDLEKLDLLREPFDLLYLSYLEVKNGAEKSDLTDSVFIPHRGLWYLSGYALSKSGAKKLLSLLPIRGPVDLWINHQFKHLKVYAASKSIIKQRLDFQSSNSYSILPVLSKIGLLAKEKPSLFELGNIKTPVFAFGDNNSGLTSLAMALSMIGYRCCSDIVELPEEEFSKIKKGSVNRIFNAYVNVGSLDKQFMKIAMWYPDAKFIHVLDGVNDSVECYDLNRLVGSSRILRFDSLSCSKWKTLCEFINCAPPASSYPELPERFQRTSVKIDVDIRSKFPYSRRLKADSSPWIVPLKTNWAGLATKSSTFSNIQGQGSILSEGFRTFQGEVWELREDTFPSNLALFSPNNFSLTDTGAVLTLKKESLGVREYSGSSICSKQAFRYGHFEAEIKPSNIPGVITGLFLHRNSPRQEIDIEFLGKDPTKLLVNVYYNPGDDGAMFDYGYRGTPVLIDLGFNASSEFHSYRIEWDPDSIRWFVDNRLIHERFNWEPTPIPHLPMQFHINLWPSRSIELAGKLRDNILPAVSYLGSIHINQVN